MNNINIKKNRSFHCSKNTMVLAQTTNFQPLLNLVDHNYIKYDDILDTKTLKVCYVAINFVGVNPILHILTID